MIFIFKERPVYLHTCVTCFVLPFNIYVPCFNYSINIVFFICNRWCSIIGNTVLYYIWAQSWYFIKSTMVSMLYFDRHYCMDNLFLFFNASVEERKGNEFMYSPRTSQLGQMYKYIFANYEREWRRGGGVN